jgi:hypothetical protein
VEKRTKMGVLTPLPCRKLALVRLDMSAVVSKYPNAPLPQGCTMPEIVSFETLSSPDPSLTL